MARSDAPTVCQWYGASMVGVPRDGRGLIRPMMNAHVDPTLADDADASGPARWKSDIESFGTFLVAGSGESPEICVHQPLRHWSIIPRIRAAV